MADLEGRKAEAKRTILKINSWKKIRKGLIIYKIF
jgi:hypothetical protein